MNAKQPRFKFYCPQCGNKTRVRNVKQYTRYCLCEDCNIIYALDKHTNKVISKIERY